MSGETQHVVYDFIVLMDSAIADGSSLAYVEKRGRASPNFTSLSPLRPYVRSVERERRYGARFCAMEPSRERS